MDGWGGLHLHRGGVVPRLSPFVRRSMEPSMQAIRLLLATCFIGLIAATGPDALKLSSQTQELR